MVAYRNVVLNLFDVVEVVFAQSMDVWETEDHFVSSDVKQWRSRHRWEPTLYATAVDITRAVDDGVRLEGDEIRMRGLCCGR